MLKISNWILFLFILYWGLTDIYAAFCHGEISSGNFTLVFHLCLCWNWLSQAGILLNHIFILFCVVLVSEGFFYRSCLLVAVSSIQNSCIIFPLDSSINMEEIELLESRTHHSLVLPSVPVQGCDGSGAVAVTELFVMPPQVHPLWSCLHDPGHAQSAHP